MPDIIHIPAGPVILAESGGGSAAFAAGLWFPRGSRHEAPHERGFSHFLEHMFFKGTARRDAPELARIVERTGGYVNAFTERDAVCLHCTVPARDWKLAIDVLLDMAFASTLPAHEFDLERQVILSEVLAAEEDTEECSHDALLARIWPGHPAARKIGGTADDVKAIGRDALAAFYSASFGPGGAVLAVSGGPGTGELADFAGERIASISTSGIPAFGIPAVVGIRDSVPAFNPVSEWSRAEGTQAYYYEAAQMNGPFGERDFHILAALNGIVGESSSSRLFQRLRERGGLCYSVYSAFSMTATECLWYAQAASPDGTLPSAAKAMSEELDRVASGDLTDTECADAAARLEGAFTLALEDPEFRMRRIAREYLSDGGAVSPEEDRKRYASVSRKDILDMAERLLGGAAKARYAYGKVSRRSAARIGLQES